MILKTIAPIDLIGREQKCMSCDKSLAESKADAVNSRAKAVDAIANDDVFATTDAVNDWQIDEH